MNVQINVSYSNSVYELKQEASKMKTIFILLLFFCNSLQAQYISLNSTSGYKLEYFKFDLSELYNRIGNSIAIALYSGSIYSQVKLLDEVY